MTSILELPVHARIKVLFEGSVVTHRSNPYIERATAFPSVEAHCSKKATRVSVRLDETAKLPDLIIAFPRTA